MLQYSKFNYSKLPSFGKIECISKNVCPDISTHSIVWCAESGTSYSHKVNIAENFMSMTPNFVCNQTDEMFHYSNLQTKLSQTNGHYYLIQLGGSSNSYLLIKIPLTKNDQECIVSHICWNALNFLHNIGWIESTDVNSKNHVLGISISLKKSFIYWISLSEHSKRLAQVPYIDIHWVWFRRANYKLTQEIIERAYSWIEMNSMCRFHLWTDIPTLDDFEDFMSQIEPEWRIRFLKFTQIHLKKETEDLIDTALNKFKLLESSSINQGIELLYNEFKSTEKHSRIYKTDFVRLFILGTIGGVYVDFNDCICLAPVREIIALYGEDTPLGVSDYYDVNHASNYFLYCPYPSSLSSSSLSLSQKTGNEHWNSIVADMVGNVGHIIGLIRNTELCAAVRKYIIQAINSLKSENMENMDLTELQTLYGSRILPYCGNENIPLYMWNKFIWIHIADIASKLKGHDLRRKIEPRLKFVTQTRARNRRQQVAFDIIDNETIDLMLKYINDDTSYNELFLFWWTDYNLRVVMHYTNLPIFCRMRKTPLILLPFGYLYSYCCALSWVGHIGDGTSYGMEGRKDNIRIRNLLKEN